MAIVDSSEISQVSVEAGHIYASAFTGTELPLVERFQRIRPYVDIARLGHTASVAFLIDDYHAHPCNDDDPATIINQIRESADEAGVTIDYIGREAACVNLAADVTKLLERTGYLRETIEQTWLVDSRPQKSLGASVISPTRLRSQHRGDLFLDIEVNCQPNTQPTSWAHPYLAAIWQGLRLGALSDPDFTKPPVIDDALPNWERWADVPPLIQFSRAAAPFVAEKTFSIMPVNFLPVGSAVRKILSRLGPTLDTRPFLERQVSYVLLNDI